MNIIKLSSRDDMMDGSKIGLEADLAFQKDFAATNIVKDLIASGYDTVESINKELKERDIEISSEVKKIVKELVAEFGKES